jgi:2-polyprenyl-3-methyl-5-hydroxy-6-metoxy-1,4-benzoquinol methylase
MPALNTVVTMTVTALDPDVATDLGAVPIDPLAAAPRGMWSGHSVRVTRSGNLHHRHDHREGLCTRRFCVQRRGGILTVDHDLTPEELCDELAVLLVDEIVETGAIRGRSEFELVFTGVVRSTVDGGMAAWLRFYRNSLRKLESGATAFAPIHHRAEELVRGDRLVDLGSCFGFFPLRMAQHGMDVLATDLSTPTMDLLDRVSGRLRRPVRTMSCNAASVPLPDGAADTVTALHLIEHLTPGLADAVLREALRLARRRVVVAVPFEDQPRACYGHVQRFDLPALHGMAARVCFEHNELRATVTEYHGGWLILDR